MYAALSCSQDLKDDGEVSVEMGLLRQKIESMMTQEDEAPQAPLCIAWILYACSKVYEAAVRVRLILYERGFLNRKRLPCKVVSIGNITVGGTGKTPMTHYVASALKGFGLEVGVISRGYGGHAQRSGGTVSDGKTILMKGDASGDEPQVLASKLTGIPLLVGKDRCRAGRKAIAKFGTSVVVLDDGFQHLPLARDVDLLLLDSDRPFGNGHFLPRGTLREPPEQIKRASAIILTRWEEDGSEVSLPKQFSAHMQGRPVFTCKHVPDGLFIAKEREILGHDYIRGRRLFLFSGIARNNHFLETVVKLQGHVAGSLAFRDHHRYSPNDLELIWNRARDLRVENIITTEKDFVNIQTEIPSRPQLMVLKISISFEDDKEAFESYLRSRLTQ